MAQNITYDGREIIVTTQYRTVLAERNRNFLRIYDKLLSQNPTAKRYTLCRAISLIVDNKVSAQTVYSVLRRYGRV